MINGDYIMIVPSDSYQGVLYRGKYCYEHHYVYWQHHNVVLESNQIIHHLDGNKHNNNIENLQLLKREDHSTYHGSLRKNKLVKLKCTGCGKEFVREKRNSFLQKGGLFSTCSKKCIGITTGLSTEEKNKRISQNLIEEFVGYKSDYI